MSAKLQVTHTLSFPPAPAVPADLTGTVPPEISQLTQLQQLDLEFNFLSGTLDQHLCMTTNNSLTTLYLRANNFSGPLDLSKCQQLQIVDIQVDQAADIL